MPGTRSEQPKNIEIALKFFSRKVQIMGSTGFFFLRPWSLPKKNFKRSFYQPPSLIQVSLLTCNYPTTHDAIQFQHFTSSNQQHISSNNSSPSFELLQRNLQKFSISRGCLPGFKFWLKFFYDNG